MRPDGAIDANEVSLPTLFALWFDGGVGASATGVTRVPTPIAWKEEEGLPMMVTRLQDHTSDRRRRLEQILESRRWETKKAAESRE